MLDQPVNGRIFFEEVIRMAYDLRRLRLHGIVQRQPHSQRYRLTP